MPVLMAGSQRRPFAGELPQQLALRSLSALAGHVLEEGVATPPDEETDERPLAPRGALSEILAGQRLDCLKEWLELCRGRRIHPALLPQALELGAGAPLLEAAGPRGLWLARQNPDWSHHLRLVGGLEVWETGSPRVRAEWLAGQEPPRAAELLREVWKQENAETRALLLRALADRADLEVLEMGLADRSKGVRTAAAQGLWRFPEFPLVRHWGDVLATAEPPPADPGFDLSIAGLGEKAGWLAQLAWLAPLGAFVEPREVWREALVQGFARAAVAQRRQDWAAGLLRAGVLDQRLFLLLDWRERDAYLLSGDARWDWYGLHRPFSAALASKIWRELQTVTQGRHDWSVAQALPALGHGFAVNQSLEQGWPEGSPHWRAWSSAVEKMLALHSFRAAMHKEMV